MHTVSYNVIGKTLQHYVILTHPPEYSMRIQAHIPPALCAIHNFIHIYDADEIHEFDNEAQDLDSRNYGDLAHGPAGAAEKTRAAMKRDQIAQAIWESYQMAL